MTFQAQTLAGPGKTPQPEERIETMIKHSIEINRPAEEVFAYLDQVDRHNEITEHDPPRKASFRGTAGLIRPVGTYTVDPTGESSSRMNSELDLEGHGIGKLFAILARRQAAKQVPVDLEKFTELLESGVAPAASN